MLHKLKRKIVFRPFLRTQTANFTQLLSTNLLNICVSEHFSIPKMIHLLKNPIKHYDFCTLVELVTMGPKNKSAAFIFLLTVR